MEALEPHTQKMNAIIAQADRVRQLQVVNINALFECEKKQAEDENKARRRHTRARAPPTLLPSTLSRRPPAPSCAGHPETAHARWVVRCAACRRSSSSFAAG